MASLRFYGGIEEIGGNKVLLEGDDARIFLDFGRSLGYYNKFFADFLQSRSKSSVRDLVKLGGLPRIDGIYRDSSINTWIDPNGLDHDKDVEWNAFIQAKDYFTADGLLSDEAWAKNNGGNQFISAIFVSHAHFDHIQDVSYLSEKIPIYCSEKTELMARVISEVSNLKSSIEFYYYRNPEIEYKSAHNRTLFPGTPEIKAKEEKINVTIPKINMEFTIDNPKGIRDYRTLKDQDSVQIGDIKVRLIETDHSIPGSCAFLITVDGKNILYTGDIRFHGASGFTIDAFCEKVNAPVHTLIIEGTRIDEPNIISELDVENDMKDEMQGAEGLILVDFNWKDIARFETVRKAAIANGRTLLIHPNLAFLLHELYLQEPDKYLDPATLDGIAVYVKRQESYLYSKSDYKTTDAGYLEEWGSTVAKDNLNLKKIKDKIDKGDQITPDEQNAWEWAMHHYNKGIRAYKVRSNPSEYAMLFSFWDLNELFDLSDESVDLHGAKYIKASCEPFNDEMIVDEQKLIRWLDHFQIQYTQDVSKFNGEPIIKRNHASGHASRPELKELIEKIDPLEYIFPIHTLYPEEFKNLVKTSAKIITSITPGKEYKV
ncbi:MAG TPA: MBL fold metallo-hydrolase RNA specificity domain-containing protein [Candidatus Lokiarchaeia archaeon]|nr:MBL fold metallo-hydrolase RNA specificity domain-containing protein [Candidatus Lokiarchaeia archaeon]